MKNKLIEIYLLVCHSYDMTAEFHLQPNRNGQSCLTVPELMTIYLFGHLNGYTKHRQIHSFIKHYWRDWFPHLPSYQAFNRRLNLLTDNFQTLFAHLMQTVNHSADRLGHDYLIDSMPIMLAQGTRSKTAKVAPEIAKIGFSAVKQTHFHGVRLHLIAGIQSGKLPIPAKVWIKEGNAHDLTVLREAAEDVPSGIRLFGDKAYADKEFKQELETQEIQLFTPIKKPRKEELTAQQKMLSKTVSKIRQPIESLFKWLIDKTDIQRASQVRSTEGLILHCLGKLTFALLLLNLYY